MSVDNVDRMPAMRSPITSESYSGHFRSWFVDVSMLEAGRNSERGMRRGPYAGVALCCRLRSSLFPPLVLFNSTIFDHMLLRELNHAACIFCTRMAHFHGLDW